jgi:hypothetical protein
MRRSQSSIHHQKLSLNKAQYCECYTVLLGGVTGSPTITQVFTATARDPKTTDNLRNTQDVNKQVSELDFVCYAS